VGALSNNLNPCNTAWISEISKWSLPKFNIWVQSKGSFTARCYTAIFTSLWTTRPWAWLCTVCASIRCDAM